MKDLSLQGALRLSAFLSEVSEMTKMCAAEARSLEEVVEVLHVSCSGAEAREVSALQKLDLIIQIQDDISALLQTLSGALPETANSESVSIQTFLPFVKLGQVKERLEVASNSGKISTSSDFPTSGECDFF